MGSHLTLHSIFTACSLHIPDSLLPAVGGLLSAIALWVGARARSISMDAQSTSEDLAALLSQLLERPVPSASRRGARARKKSSTKETTST